MAEVALLFQLAWRAAVLAGAKTTTVRTRRYGAAGDTFVLEGVTFRLVAVEAMPLARAHEGWREEGFDSADAFERGWVENHPTRGWRPGDTVWVHRFERLL